MKRGVHSELSLRGEIEHALQYGEPPMGHDWTAELLAFETEATDAEVEDALADLQEEGMVTLKYGVVTWN